MQMYLQLHMLGEWTQRLKIQLHLQATRRRFLKFSKVAKLQSYSVQTNKDSSAKMANFADVCLVRESLWLHRTIQRSLRLSDFVSTLYFKSDSQESGLTQRFSLFGRSSSEPEELPSCHSDTAVSDKDSSEDIYAMDKHASYLFVSD